MTPAISKPLTLLLEVQKYYFKLYVCVSKYLTELDNIV